MADTSYAVPVYRGWPERHYRILGSLSFPDPNARWNEDFFGAAAKRAKQLNADAIVVRQGAEFGVSKIAEAKNDPLVISRSQQTTALVIRWLTPQEIKDRGLLVDELLKRFAANEPGVAANREVAVLVTIFLSQQGYDLKTAEILDRCDETLRKLVSRGPASPAGDWIYKATVSLTTLSGGDERNYLGLASVSVDGENLAIVSSAGGLEINFTGTLSKGRLSGQIGVGGFSAKCEGAATPEKMSISFQSLTSDGTVRGNVVLQRLPLKSNNNEKTPPNPAGKRAEFGDGASV